MSDNSNIRNADTAKPITIIKALGIKATESLWVQGVFIVILITVVVVHIYLDTRKRSDQCEVTTCHQIRPGMMLHDSLEELDPKSKKKMLAVLDKTLNNEDQTVLAKYTNTIISSVCAGVFTEYFIHGNVGKPISVLARTFVYGTMSILLSSLLS